MAGNTIIIILLVPLLFQVFWLATLQNKRHRETMERLSEIEARLRQLP